MKRLIKETSEKLKSLTKWQIISFVIAVSVTASAYLLQEYAPKVSLTIFVIVFGLFILILWVKAGSSIFKTFIELSGTAGIVISVTIFIVQQYCALPLEKQVSTGSLVNLYAFGLIYSLYLFVSAFTKQIKRDISEFKETNNNKHSWLILVVYLGLVLLFLWQFYAVINPIVTNLCIYK